MPGLTVVDISLAASSLPIDVWKDPYIAGSPRGDTERTTSGLHFAFDELFGSGFQLEWSATEIDLDDERSGEGLGLDGADQRLLRRTGNVYRLDLSYDWKINQRNRIEPVLGWVDFDLDGDAMAEDGPALAVRHLYEIDRWYIVSQLYYQDLESDSRNPVFGKVRQLETLGASFTVFYSEPFGLDRWKATASLGYQEDDSNIDFYDSSFGLFSLGMFYRFD